MSIEGSRRSNLFLDLVDDAAMFPPGNAPASLAVVTHTAVKRGPLADYVGPLLVAADRWDELLEARRQTPAPLEIVLVGEPRPGTVGLADAAVIGSERVWDGEPVPATAMTSRLALEPADLGAVEDLLAVVGEARIDGSPMIAKFRTGGITAEAFPSEDALAYCVYAAYNAGVPFKLTAGLHHAVRHTDSRTGFEHHGFLNVMVAVARCAEGAGEEQVSEALAARDADALLERVSAWSDDDAVAVRSMFVSFGCCGVEDPIQDLLDMGLIPGSASAGVRG